MKAARMIGLTLLFFNLHLDEQPAVMSEPMESPLNQVKTKQMVKAKNKCRTPETNIQNQTMKTSGENTY